MQSGPDSNPRTGGRRADARGGGVEARVRAARLRKSLWRRNNCARRAARKWHTRMHTVAKHLELEYDLPFPGRTLIGPTAPRALALRAHIPPLPTVHAPLPACATHSTGPTPASRLVSSVVPEPCTEPPGGVEEAKDGSREEVELLSHEHGRLHAANSVSQAIIGRTCMHARRELTHVHTGNT